jgi:hypothetical protein
MNHCEQKQTAKRLQYWKEKVETKGQHKIFVRFLFEIISKMLIISFINSGMLHLKKKIHLHNIFGK